MRTVRSLLLAAVVATPSYGARASVPPAVNDAAPTVTLNVIGTDFKRLAPVLSRQTGLRLRVSRDIADERLDVFVHDMPWKDFAGCIEAMYGYRWLLHELPSGADEYILTRDMNTERRQEKLRERLRKAPADARRKGLEELDRVSSMSDEEIDALHGYDPARARFAQRNAEKRLMHRLRGAERERFIAGLPVDASAALKDPAFVASLKRSMEAGYQTALDSSEFSKLTWSSQMEAFAPRPAWDTDGRTVYLKVDEGGGRAMQWSVNVFSLGPQKVLVEQPPTLESADKPDGKPWNPDTSDPRLPKMVKKPDGKWPTFHEYLQAAAEATGVPMISDYYCTGNSGGNMPGDKASDLLPALSASRNRYWTVHGGALLFRDDKWPLRMECDIPLDTLLELERLGGKGRLNLAQSLLAASLDDIRLPSLAPAGYDAPWSRDTEQLAALRFLAALSKPERGRLTSPRGMAIGEIPGEARERFEALGNARWTNKGYVADVRAVALSREDTKDRTTLTFTFPLIAPNGAYAEWLSLRNALGPGQRSALSSGGLPTDGLPPPILAALASASSPEAVAGARLKWTETWDARGAGEVIGECLITLEGRSGSIPLATFPIKASRLTIRFAPDKRAAVAPTMAVDGSHTKGPKIIQ